MFLASAGRGQGGDAQGAQPGAPSGGSVWIERALASDPMTSVTSGALPDLLGKPGLDELADARESLLEGRDAPPDDGPHPALDNHPHATP
ncbi:hypothetical protein [Sorangium sp. So ce124]|uniref:hypothetical protein n=1 Tax=Sorangium sp. So ce124 TaxID=3133280 RepID=UPI003F5FAF8B